MTERYFPWCVNVYGRVCMCRCIVDFSCKSPRCTGSQAWSQKFFKVHFLCNAIIIVNIITIIVTHHQQQQVKLGKNLSRKNAFEFCFICMCIFFFFPFFCFTFSFGFFLYSFFFFCLWWQEKIVKIGNYWLAISQNQSLRNFRFIV